MSVSVRTVFREDSIPNNHPDYRYLRFGWRWYWVNDGTLVSPIEGEPLPHHGALSDAFMIPRLDLMLLALRGSWLSHTAEQIAARGFALTFGVVRPPFSPDHNLNQAFGSTRVGRYEATVICTTQPVSRRYAMRRVPSLDLDVLQSLEAQATLTPGAMSR